MNRRTFTGPDRNLIEFIDRVLVRCPDCDGAASVDYLQGIWLFRCLACGAVKDKPNRGKSPYKGKPHPALVGAPFDPFFYHPLLLQANYRGKILWAYNWSHLAFLEDAIAAELRPSSPSPRQLRNKLPKWMLLAKNREGLLKTVRQIRQKYLRAV